MKSYEVRRQGGCLSAESESASSSENCSVVRSAACKTTGTTATSNNNKGQQGQYTGIPTEVNEQQLNLCQLSLASPSDNGPEHRESRKR